MLETDQTCDCVGDTKAECVVLDLKEGLCSRQTQSRDLINPGWHSPFYLAGILTHLAPLHSPDWHRELSSKINSADEIIQYKDTWQIRSNSDAHLNTWKPFFFFFCGRRILQSYRIKELMARKENDLVIKHAEYQIGGEKKKIIDPIFDNMSVARWLEAQLHAQSEPYTCTRKHKGWHLPCLSSISPHSSHSTPLLLVSGPAIWLLCGHRLWIVNTQRVWSLH